MSFYKDEQLIQLLSKIRLPAYATAPKIQRQKPSPSTTITSTLSRSPSSGGRSKILERMFGFFRREDKIIEERRENSDKNVSDSSNSNMPQQQPNTISGNDISSPFAEEERQINELVSSLLADITEQLRVLKTQSNEHRQLYERQVDKGKRTKNMVDLEMALGKSA